MADYKGLNFTKEQLQELYDLGYSGRDIAKLYDVNPTTIKYWTDKLGCYSNYLKPQYKENFFDKIDSKEKAYMLGFLLGDSGIDKRGHIICSVALRDKEILYSFSKWTGCKVTESNKKDVKAKLFPNATIHIGNKKIAQKLIMLFGGRLKQERHIPIISKKFESYFIQGFFDAEGCVTFGYRKDRNRLWKKISFTSQLKMLSGIQKILEKQGINSKLYPKSDSNCYVLELSQNTSNILKILNYIYSDENFIILNRKYQKTQALRLELGENGEGCNSK